MAVKTSFFRVLFGGSGRLGLRSPMRSRGASYRLGLLLLPGLLLTVLPLLAQSTIYNVRSYGAKGDGVTDDAPAIQKAELAAENAGGGKVYIPAGSYWMNSAVLVGSNIELYGDGDSTLLHRSNTPSNIPSYTADCTTTKPPTMSLTLLLANRHYNCKDVNIYLHDFKADGSAITTVPSGPFFGFSGLVSSTLANITLVNTPQDGMFFRNGGQNLVVKNNRILLHNTRWGNGSGINVETHVNGEISGTGDHHQQRDYCGRHQLLYRRAQPELQPGFGLHWPRPSHLWARQRQQRGHPSRLGGRHNPGRGQHPQQLHLGRQ